MFLRKLETGECQEHGSRCKTARLMECNECHGEFVIHGEINAPRRSYCSRECRNKGSKAVFEHGEEMKKKWARIKYGRAPAQNQK
jgi:hypothetical protein